jgi:hypothetical protein
MAIPIFMAASNLWNIVQAEYFTPVNKTINLGAIFSNNIKLDGALPLPYIFSHYKKYQRWLFKLFGNITVGIGTVDLNIEDNDLALIIEQLLQSYSSIQLQNTKLLLK